MVKPELNPLTAENILNSLADGVYVTDVDRNIIFWNKAAEQITEWKAEEVVGHSCFDNILVHIDKDGNPLCGKEFCPLHRSIMSGERSTYPLILFAQTKDGSRVPLQVSVSPIVNSQGHIIGGVEVFRDLSRLMKDLDRARIIQDSAMKTELPDDPRIDIQIYNVPQEYIGGDFYRAEALDADHYAFMVADVMGHGVSAALYTMQLRSLWEDGRDMMPSPERFMSHMNQGLSVLVGDNNYFATAAYAWFDLREKKIWYAGAGHPYPFLFREKGEILRLESTGLPLGMLRNSSYIQKELPLLPNDSLLIYSDGAVEVFNPEGKMLGEEGFLELTKSIGYPHLAGSLRPVQEMLLLYNQQLRLADDLTLLSVKYTG
jgi:PAS domain S-box-containing protein